MKKERNDEYRQCYDCVYNMDEEPNPCQSCYQPIPTNFAETRSDE